MADYRLYCLDSDGHIGLADEIEANSDEEAKLKASELRPNANRSELWQKGRLVAKLHSDGRFVSGGDENNSG